jgi:glucan 1,3-beta-glucosidase
VQNGSGGFMGDLIFNGGKIGMWLGNQQFTVRNVTVNNAATAIFAAWNWGWTYQGEIRTFRAGVFGSIPDHSFIGITINNAQIGFDVLNGNTVGTVGGIALIDVVINNTPIGIRTGTASNGSLHGSIVVNNMKLNNVPSAIAVTDGTVILAGSTRAATIASWGMGNVYSGKKSQGHFVEGNIPAGNKDASLLDSAGRIFGRGHPQYADYDVSQFVSARSAGAKGDGVTDDTAALQALFKSAAKCQIVFLDAGVYYITNTRAFPVSNVGCSG